MADDDGFNILAIKGLMRVLGMKDINQKVDLAYDGEQLVQKVRDHPDSYSLIITDCNMPVMNGFQASKQIREIMGDRQLRIVLVTGFVEPEYIKKAKDSGIDEIYAKPFPILKLG